MLKPEHVTIAMLRKVLLRAFYATTENNGWLTVNEGLPCVVSMRADVDRKFVVLNTWYGLPHLEEAEISAITNRLNVEYFLVKFVAAKDKINMFYSVPYGEGLNPATLIRMMRVFARVTADAYASVPKPLGEMRQEEKQQPQRLH